MAVPPILEGGVVEVDEVVGREPVEVTVDDADVVVEAVDDGVDLVQGVVLVVGAVGAGGSTGWS